MRGAERVVPGLDAPREARDAVDHAQARHRVAPAGEDLVRIGLVADVPDDTVLGRLEDVVQGDRQLDGAQIRRDRKSTRLNSSHSQISYAVFCLKKKNPPPHLVHRADRSTPWTATCIRPQPTCSTADLICTAETAQRSSPRRIVLLSMIATITVL